MLPANINNRIIKRQSREAIDIARKNLTLSNRALNTSFVDEINRRDPLYLPLHFLVSSPVEQGFLVALKDLKIWSIACINPAINWSEDFIRRNAYKLKWDMLSVNSGLPWSISFLEKYNYKWRWDLLQENSGLLHSEEIFEHFISKFDVKTLEKKKEVISPKLMLRSVSNALSKKITNLSGVLPSRSLEKTGIKLNWSLLSNNPGLPLTETFIERYEDRWDWDFLSINQGLSVSEACIEKFADKWNWKWLSCNELLPWSEDFIERYEDRWDWGFLSGNEGLPWSPAFVEKYRNKWDWNIMVLTHGFWASEECASLYPFKEKIPVSKNRFLGKEGEKLLVSALRYLFSYPPYVSLIRKGAEVYNVPSMKDNTALENAWLVMANSGGTIFWSEETLLQYWNYLDNRYAHYGIYPIVEPYLTPELVMNITADGTLKRVLSNLNFVFNNKTIF